MARSGEARRVREQAGLSLREAAAELGVDHSTLGRWETGRVAPRRDHALAWAQLLDALTALVAQAWTDRATRQERNRQ